MLVRQIVAQATMLFERLAQVNHLAEDDFIPSSANHAYLEVWQNAISANGTTEELEAYWQWLGILPLHAQQTLSSIVLSELVPLPDWAVLLSEALQHTQSAGDNPEARFMNTDYPFGELWIPLVQVMSQRIAPYTAHLAPSARQDIEDTLLSRLSKIAAEVVFGEFDAYRKRSLGAFAAFVKPGATDLYRRFIAQMRMTPNQAPLLEKYPMLARLVASRSYWWAEAQIEFLARLNSDWVTLIDQFAGGTPPGALVALKVGVSDYHRGGRSAILLMFESGLRIVYKPKPLGMEVAYNQFLGWLNAHNAPLEMKALRVLDCGAYGWVEFAEHLPLTDEESAQRYYQRIGAMGCLLYLLLGTDCHHENLIASGEYPVLIDHEMLFSHAIFRASFQPDSVSQAYQLISRSALASFLFPEWLIASPQEGEDFDLSGIGALETQYPPATELVWQESNTDRMSITRVGVKIQPDTNIPLLAGKVVLPEPYLGAILDGFQAMYRYFMAQKEQMIAADSPLALFKGQNGRFLVRHSNDYATLLKAARHPSLLKDGLAYSLHLENLAQFFPSTQRNTPHLLILQAERQAMVRGDIPLFVAKTDSCALFTEDGSVITETYFEKSAFDHMLHRLSTLDERDLVWQLRLIKLSVESRLPSARQEQPEIRGMGEPHDAVLSPDAFLEEATRIGRILEEQAIWGQDGSVTWLAPYFNSVAQRQLLQPLTLSLYNGQAGVALFLAQATRFKLWEGARALCFATLQPIRLALANSTLDMRKLGLGAGFGLGAWLYVLARVGQWLEDSSLIEEARQGALRLTPSIIASDRRFDVLEGVAGALVGLLAVYEATADSDVLARAVLCGNHLVENRQNTAHGARAWDTFGDGTQWVGFSHGVAGIAYPLMRLYGITGQQVFRVAAEEAMGYENSTFDPQEGNWKRVFSEQFVAENGENIHWFWSTWCHGAPGIGLSRSASLRWVDTIQMRQDITIALTTTQSALQTKPTPDRFLCCGDMGRIECLFTMARLTQQSNLETLARRYASKIIEQATHTNGYRPTSRQDSYQIYNPSFFVGISGIGYELLRLVYPDQVPSVLLWE